MDSKETLHAAALRALEKFAEANGYPYPEWVEKDCGDGVIGLIAKTTDGQEYAIGYQCPA